MIYNRDYDIYIEDTKLFPDNIKDTINKLTVGYFHIHVDSTMYQCNSFMNLFILRYLEIVTWANVLLRLLLIWDDI